MPVQHDFRKLGCAECAAGAGLGFDFTMAYQPIVDLKTQTVFAQEALVRGLNNESARSIFELIDCKNRYRFDQACRVKAIQGAAALGMTSALSINFMPNAVYQPELCIRTTIEAAREFGFPLDQIIFEITETEEVEDLSHLRNIVEYYQKRGFRTAIDDFGAGYSGLNLLAEFRTDFVKLDGALIRGIHLDKARQIIAKGIIQICHDLAVQVIAECVESPEEIKVLRDFGVNLFQGYYFARPAFRSQAIVPRAAYDALQQIV
ncbi:MAG: EAL domain-containing protein [Synechococcaceae cyanobacterium RM1_1_27]|nr:EAL domain-containing protein [Synechococcaceae cyanobacterium SM2_3_2]NJO86078.1 EAL domain-containing protein [Synechococcaceae cyanobacterium RM1_1_27]